MNSSYTERNHVTEKGIIPDDKNTSPNTTRSLSLYMLLLLITWWTAPKDPFSDTDAREPINAAHVWFYGWITALSTGIGALPFLCVTTPSGALLGVSNAIAAGVMISASASLLLHGLSPTEQLLPLFADGFEYLNWWVSPLQCLVALGVGWGFVVTTKRCLEAHDHVELDRIEWDNFRKMVLVVLVMTLHSFSEGVAIGVSFGGDSESRLGFFVSLSLAVHNVPEGLAVAIVLLPRGVSKMDSALWSIFTSLPQAIMAVPAFIGVSHFAPFLPIGLGFAAGAMLNVALCELVPDALSGLGRLDITVSTTISAFGVMSLFQFLIRDSL